MPPWGVVLGLAVAAVGVWLIRQTGWSGRSKRIPVPEPVTVAEPR